MEIRKEGTTGGITAETQKGPYSTLYLVSRSDEVEWSKGSAHVPRVMRLRGVGALVRVDGEQTLEIPRGGRQKLGSNTDMANNLLHGCIPSRGFREVCVQDRARYGGK